jgi:hypothetical protein
MLRKVFNYIVFYWSPRIADERIKVRSNADSESCQCLFLPLGKISAMLGDSQKQVLHNIR